MTAQEITKALAARHTEDVFIPECKDGPSAGSSHLRLDAWAMRKSWSNPTTYGYEIKVSRSDFIRDDKWHRYLELCSMFFFVCPPGLIQPTELPENVGLLWTSQTGERLFVKKKAPYREVAVPETMYRYILMNRVGITRYYSDHPRGSGAWWKQWLERRDADLETGKLVGKKLRALVSEKVDKVQTENLRLQKMVENVEETIELLKKYGFDLRRGPVSEWTVRDRLKQMREMFPPHLLRMIEDAAIALDRISQQVRQEEKKLEAAV